MVLAAPVENRARKCGEATGDWSKATCSGDYDTISYFATKCCSDGASYCPPPQLCADPAAFDPDAAFEYRCYAMITASFTAEQCSAAGCYPSDHEGTGYCSCQVTDSSTCLAKLTGEIMRMCGVV